MYFFFKFNGFGLYSLKLYRVKVADFYTSERKKNLHAKYVNKYC